MLTRMLERNNNAQYAHVAAYRSSTSGTYYNKLSWFVMHVYASLLLWDEVVDVSPILELFLHVNEKAHSIHNNLNQLHLMRSSSM